VLSFRLCVQLGLLAQVAGLGLVELLPCRRGAGPQVRRYRPARARLVILGRTQLGLHPVELRGRLLGLLLQRQKVALHPVALLGELPLASRDAVRFRCGLARGSRRLIARDAVEAPAEVPQAVFEKFAPDVTPRRFPRPFDSGCSVRPDR
jgi:hypothetical protein